jgi:hypothetical protein
VDIPDDLAFAHRLFAPIGFYLTNVRNAMKVEHKLSGLILDEYHRITLEKVNLLVLMKFHSEYMFTHESWRGEKRRP